MRNIPFVLLALLLFFLPFHPFLITFLGDSLFQENTQMFFLIKAWKEICVAVLLGSVLLFRSKKEPFFDAFTIAVFLFSCVSLLTGILFTGEGFPENSLQIIWGFKYGVLFLWLCVAVRHFSFSEEQKRNLISITLLSGSVVIGFGALQASGILPEDVLVSFGYSEEYGNTEKNGEISYCHKIENAITHQEFCRTQSTLSGPNQLGAYLLILLPLLLFRILRAKRFFSSFLYAIPFFFGIFVLLSTWSRSAWIGAAAMTISYFVLEARNSRVAFLFLTAFILGISALFAPALSLENWDVLKIPSLSLTGSFLLMMGILMIWNIFQSFFSHIGGVFLSALLAGALVVRALFDTFFWNILLRPSSSQGHWERWGDGARSIWEHPFGLGLGDAGPASAMFAHPGETGFLPESWYLQVGLESGVLGLVLFVGILLILLYQLYNSSSPSAHPLLFALIGVSTASFFLHSWESSVVSLVFWGLAGATLAPRISASFFESIGNILRKILKKE